MQRPSGNDAHPRSTGHDLQPPTGVVVVSTAQDKDASVPINTSTRRRAAATEQKRNYKRPSGVVAQVGLDSQLLTEIEVESITQDKGAGAPMNTSVRQRISVTVQKRNHARPSGADVRPPSTGLGFQSPTEALVGSTTQDKGASATINTSTRRRLLATVQKWNCERPSGVNTQAGRNFPFPKEASVVSTAQEKGASAPMNTSMRQRISVTVQKRNCERPSGTDTPNQLPSAVATLTAEATSPDVDGTRNSLGIPTTPESLKQTTSTGIMDCFRASGRTRSYELAEDHWIQTYGTFGAVVKQCGPRGLG